MTPWRTAIVRADETSLRIHGYDVTALMRESSFAGLFFLFHRGRLPTAAEARLLNAIMIGVADHGPGAPSCAAARIAASGNRQALSAAVAAGVLAIGDEHAGASSNCMELIAAGLALAEREGLSIAEAAARMVDDSSAAGRRLPGLGHRVHTTDPRVATLFEMARADGIAGNGVAFMEALEAAAAAKIKKLPMNIDGALAAVMHDMGFAPDAGRFIVIVGRVGGLTAEVAEEHRREKPMRFRFDVEYDGVPPRSE
jgi:citrate synthase